MSLGRAMGWAVVWAAVGFFGTLGVVALILKWIALYETAQGVLR